MLMTMPSRVYIKVPTFLLSRLRVVLYGGSHGGFVVLHMASKHPKFYRCVVSRNGVVNVATKMATTDIQNWSYDGDVTDLKFLSPGPGLFNYHASSS